MLFLLSPSKTLDLDSPCPQQGLTQPRMLDRTQVLAGILKGYNEKQLMKLMGISEKLASLNADRYRRFSQPFTIENARPALWTFKGDVYEGMRVADYSQKQIEYAQGHVRMLSGLYGLLRPLDLMQPYRLEMGTDLKNPSGKNLYDFWKKDVVRLLNEDLAALPASKRVIINLASQEYFKAVDVKALEAPVVTVQFKEDNGQKLRVIALFAKRARGLMADYAIRHGAKNLDGLKKFGEEGYRFMSELSSEGELVFARQQPKKK